MTLETLDVLVEASEHLGPCPLQAALEEMIEDDDVTDAALVILLQTVSKRLDDQADVVDSSYGEPAPNRAMHIKQRVDQLLEEL